MIKLEFSDENTELGDVMKKLISALLPHENFDKRYFMDILNKITALVHEDEMPIDYYVIIHCLQDLSKINLVVDSELFTPKLKRDTLEQVMSSSLIEYMKQNRWNVESWMRENSQECNLELDENLESAAEFIYNKTLELYDECYDFKITSEDAMTYLVAYKNAFLANALDSQIRTSIDIRTKGVRIGRKRYYGIQGALDYMTMLKTEIDVRTSAAAEDIMTIDTVDKMIAMQNEAMNTGKFLCNRGIPELDDATPIMTNRLDVYVASPNVGKTIAMKDLSARLIMEGKKVAFYPGESPEPTIDAGIKSAYIYMKHKLYVSTNQILGKEEADEDTQRIINLVSVEFAEKGLLSFIKRLTYDNCYDELVTMYNKTQFDVVIIDHSCSLTSAPNSQLFSMKQKLDSEGIQLREFKKNYPVNVAVTSHTSDQAKTEIAKFGHVFTDGSTRESSIWNAEADNMFIFIKKDELSRQGLIACQVKKRRDKEAPVNDINLMFKNDYGVVIYSPDYQDTEAVNYDKEAAISDIERIQGISEDDGDDFMDMEFFGDDDE